MLRIARVTAALLVAFTFSPAMAQGGFDPGRLYVGAGLGYNDFPGSDEEVGWQVFGGYEIGAVAKDVYLDAEVGYMNAGDSRSGEDVDGLWATAVGRLRVGPQFDLIGRLGFDFGDDDGLMIGVGAGVPLSRRSALRLEYVDRDEIGSLQLNFIYRP